jgi:hypothetical protein
MLIDTISTTTKALASQRATEVISRQAAYPALFSRNEYADNVFRTATPIAGELVNIIIQVNLLRSYRTLSPENTSYINSVTAVFHSLDAIDMDALAETATSTIKIKSASSYNSHHRDVLVQPAVQHDIDCKIAWLALVTAYHSAVTIYAISSLAGFGSSAARMKNLATATSSAWSSMLIAREKTAYRALISSISCIFRQRAERRAVSTGNRSIGFEVTSVGLLHKFLVWPMVMAGIQASLVEHDEVETKSLCWKMRQVGKELGTFGMIDGAQFVEGLLAQGHQKNTLRAWDDIFLGMPLFLM